MPVILTLGEWRQEDYQLHTKFGANLDCMKPYLKKKNEKEKEVQETSHL